jgi:hypothetical protein
MTPTRGVDAPILPQEDLYAEGNNEDKSRNRRGEQRSSAGSDNGLLRYWYSQVASLELFPTWAVRISAWSRRSYTPHRAYDEDI